MSRKFAASAFRVVGAVGMFVLLVGGCLSQPSFRRSAESNVMVDEGRLQAHVGMLSQTLHPRDWKHVDNLEKCADYIASHFTNAGAVVESQVFEVRDRQYRNV